MLWSFPGTTNTPETIAAAVEACRQAELKHIVVASNTGNTIYKLLEHDVSGLNIVCVTHQVGFKEPGEHEMTEATRKDLGAKGVSFLTTTHLFGGVDRAISKKHGGLYPPDIIGNSLRMFGQGVKVAVEIAIMALDAGVIPYGVDVMAVGGTSRGADSACIVRPAHSLAAFDTRVVNVICRPEPPRD